MATGRADLLRAIATGAQVVVHSADPRRWDPMLTAVDDPDRLGLAPVEHSAGAREWRSTTASPHQRIQPVSRSFTSRRAARPPPRPADAPASTVFIRQDRHDQRTFSVDTHTGTTRISVVAVDDEWVIINGRPAAPALGATGHPCHRPRPLPGTACGREPYHVAASARSGTVPACALTGTSTRQNVARDDAARTTTSGSPSANHSAVPDRTVTDSPWPCVPRWPRRPRRASAVRIERNRLRQM